MNIWGEIGQGIGDLASCADAYREDTLFAESCSRRDEAPEERHIHAPQGADEPLEPGGLVARLGGRHASRLQGHRASRGLVVEHHLGDQSNQAGGGRYARQDILGKA